LSYRGATARNCLHLEKQRSTVLRSLQRPASKAGRAAAGSCHSGGAPPVSRSAGRAAAACRRNRSAPAGRRRRPAGPARAPARPAAAARPGSAQMVQPPHQLEVLAPGPHRVDGRVLAGRSTLSRIMDSSLSRRRGGARCPVACRFPWPCDRPAQGRCEAGKRSSPDPGDPPRRDSAGRDGTAAARAGECGGTGVCARLTARSFG
jgi:hypothetical protein